MTLPWTDERIETLKLRWREGFSASEIAAELGGSSRNAVISKVHRLNLPRLAHNLERKRLVAADRKKPAVSRIAKHKRRPIGPPADLPIPPVPSVGLLSLLQLTEHTCKWPIGDPKLAGFGFCGSVSVPGKPYCADHCSQAYSRVSTVVGHIGENSLSAGHFQRTTASSLHVQKGTQGA